MERAEEVGGRADVNGAALGGKQWRAVLEAPKSRFPFGERETLGESASGHASTRARTAACPPAKPNCCCNTKKFRARNR